MQLTHGTGRDAILIISTGSGPPTNGVLESKAELLGVGPSPFLVVRLVPMTGSGGYKGRSENTVGTSPGCHQPNFTSSLLAWMSLYIYQEVGGIKRIPSPYHYPAGTMMSL